jgi:hypothetical protein
MAAAGGACKPRLVSASCGTGMACLATSIDTGMCAAPTAETEPNDIIPMATAVATTPALVGGSLAFADVDCYSVTVQPGHSLFAYASLHSGRCPGVMAELALDVYTNDPTRGVTLLGGDVNSSQVGCPRIDGNDPFMNFSWARNTGAANATYYVCVRDNFTTPNPIPNYVLSLATPATM